MCHRHHLPFQALGGVHGQHLDPVAADGQLGRRQTVLDHLGDVQISQQARNRRLAGPSAGPFGVPRDHVGERIKVLGSGPAT
ncbi:Uncharacterised protein [Mycobacterium tuberculosis]|nr:Uncharacterised protein [Mycobacterium tuberculosis]